jgi:hypothetical protein
MPSKESEDKVKKLEAKVKELENRIGIQEDIEEIRHLMSKYEIWHVPGKVTETWKLFTMKQPDVSAEIDDWGVYVGPQSVRKLYEEGHVVPAKGTMHTHHLDTYVIQVAKDRKTAKGIFFSPGHETWVRADGKIATWVWGKYGNDFIKEDGEWKIWHLHWYTAFRTDYYKSWQEEFKLPFVEKIGSMKDKIPPQRPTTYHKPYSIDFIMDVMPDYPEPFDTWDGKSVA